MSYLVMGLGVSGFATVRFLQAKGHAVHLIDTRKQPPLLERFQAEFPTVSVECEQVSPDCFDKAAHIILSPGIAPSHPWLVGHEDKVMGDIELFARHVTAPVLAITGTNGKSTVTTLLGDLCRAAGLNAAVGGNLGTAALDLLLQAEADVYILELSSFQLETTRSLAPHAACILNISPDHLDRHQTYDAYIAAKKRIYQNARFKIYNADDPNTFPSDLSQSVCFSLQDSSADFYLQADGNLMQRNKALVNSRDLCIKGKQNIANALAALAMSSCLELDLSRMFSRLKAFKGLAHRCEWVRRLADVDWVNDSKGTNVGASCAAIAGFAEQDIKNIIFIAGGQGKGQDFSVLHDSVKQSVRKAILFGEDKLKMKKCLQTATDVHLALDLENAVELAQSFAHRGDTVLFSPACASFDMFDNFEQRGHHFKQFVGKLV